MIATSSPFLFDFFAPPNYHLDSYTITKDVHGTQEAPIPTSTSSLCAYLDRFIWLYGLFCLSCLLYWHESAGLDRETSVDQTWRYLVHHSTWVSEYYLGT